ncbi:glycosyltransferase family protein [Companilactobacillus mishanensis]|uniref:hypothetical protein n=1 Tax=Companilactobacillus mishanensis TaxID=2486008 RepID=UPI000F7A34AB|nr:hypothetical protein [Companilactobacillus mishanensis]
MSTRDKRILIVIDILLFILVIYPVFQGGVIGGYDPGFHMGRIKTLASNIASGHFPNPIGFEYLDKLGYGVGFFYGNFLLYPFAILHLLGLSTYAAYILFLAFFVIMCIVGINVATQKLFQNSWTTFFSAPIYLSSYYFISLIYIRAAAGELVALAIIPWVLLSVFKMVQGETKYWIMFGISFSLLLVSHILSFLIVVVTALLILIMNLVPIFKNVKIFFSFIKGTALFLGLSAVFLLPFVEQYTVQSYNSTAVDGYGNYLIIVYSIWMKNHVFDPAQFISTNGQFLTYLLLFAILYYVFKLIWKRGHISKNKIIPQSLIIIILFASLIVSPDLLQFAVKVCKPLVLLQVITRLNVMILPLLTFLAANALGEIVHNWGKFRLPVVGVFMIALAVITVMNPIKQNMQQVKARPQHIPVGSISMGEYEPKDFMNFMIKNNFQVNPKLLETTQDIDITANNHHEAIIKVNNIKGSKTLMLPRLYYKGYQVTTKYAGKTVTKPAIKKNGLVSTKLPNNFKSGTLKVTYRNTTASKVGWFITITTLLIMLCRWILKVPRKIGPIKSV